VDGDYVGCDEDELDRGDNIGGDNVANGEGDDEDSDGKKKKEERGVAICAS
jgi:hypothetical protein